MTSARNDNSVWELYASTQLPDSLLENAALDMEAWIAERVAARMLRSEVMSFLAGSPTKRRPRGVLVYRLQALQARLGERRRARRRKLWPRVRRGKWWGAA